MTQKWLLIWSHLLFCAADSAFKTMREEDFLNSGGSVPLDNKDSPLSEERKNLNLAGKDWLTEPEAAFYCGVSITQFKKHAPSYGLAPRNFMGKKLYEKAELFAAISHSPQVGRSPSPGIAVDMGNSPAMREALDRLRRHELRKRR